jgi:uncharacterized damage-inducible protein DinB
MHAIAGEMPEKPGIDGPERQLASARARSRARDMIQEPGDLRAAEIRVDYKARPLSHQVIGAGLPQFLAQRGGTTVLPDNRIVQRFAALPVPHDGGFALVCDAYGRQIFKVDARGGHCLARDLTLSGEDFFRIMLDPSGLRVDLPDLTLGYSNGSALFVEEDGARTGGTLIESENVRHERIIRQTEVPMLSKEYEALIAHMEWADARIWSAVLQRAEARTDSFTRQRLHHIHSVHWFYSQIWRGEPVELSDVAAFKEIEEIRNWGREGHSKVRDCLKGIDEAALARNVELPFKQQIIEYFGEVRPVTFSETILQLTSHSSHHRGQVSARLRDLGGDPPMTDFVVWLLAGRPPADWT